MSKNLSVNSVPEPSDPAAILALCCCHVGCALLVVAHPLVLVCGTRSSLEFDETILNEKDLQRAMVDAGALIGLGDWRPKFGRFLVK